MDFVSINNNIDTTTSQGRLMFNLFASFAEFEREMISERTKAGLANARRHGRKVENLVFQKKRVRDSDAPMSQNQKELGLSKVTFYRYLKWMEEEEKTNKKSRSKR